MSSQKRICLVGATGLVGSQVIEQAIIRSDLRIVGIARREVPLPYGSRMEMLLADPSGWDDAIAASGAKVLVCALGTTWRKAGKDEAAFRAVDRDLVISCARAAKAAGIDHMIVVSSVGADIHARSLYLRVKGEMEEALAKVGLRRLDILRPGLLVGQRSEHRPLERLAMLASPLVDLLLHGKYRKFRSIRADTLARVIFALAREKAGGRFVHGHDSMRLALRRAGDKSGPREYRAVDSNRTAGHAARVADSAGESPRSASVPVSGPAGRGAPKEQPPRNLSGQRTAPRR